MKYLEYIESTGAQCIDTGIVPGNDMRLDVLFCDEKADKSYENYFGCAGKDYGLIRDSTSTTFRLEYGSSTKNFGHISGDMHYVDDGENIYVNDALMTTRGSISPSSTMCVFAKRSGSGFDVPGVFRLYYFKMYSGETLVIHLVPAVDNDGAACLYDEVSGEFFYNIGTGAFVEGPELILTVRKYLISSDGIYYTEKEGSLQSIEITELTGQVFLDYGFDNKPEGSLLVGLNNPQILLWQDSLEELPVLNASVTAVPPPQIVCTETQDMSDPSISWIENMQVDATENILFSFASIPDVWKVYNADSGQWEPAAEGAGMNKTQVEAVTAEQWQQLAGESKLYWIRFLIPDETGNLSNIVINYKNQEDITHG